MGYLITKSVNKIDEFKYYYKHRKFYYCDCLGSSFTRLRDDKKIDFFAIPFNENYDDYLKMMIMVHHGFVDAYHINLFLELLAENMENLGNKMIIF